MVYSWTTQYYRGLLWDLPLLCLSSLNSPILCHSPCLCSAPVTLIFFLCLKHHKHILASGLSLHPLASNISMIHSLTSFSSSYHPTPTPCLSLSVSFTHLNFFHNTQYSLTDYTLIYCLSPPVRSSKRVEVFVCFVYLCSLSTRTIAST